MCSLILATCLALISWLVAPAPISFAESHSVVSDFQFAVLAVPVAVEVVLAEVAAAVLGAAAVASAVAAAV